MMKTSEGLRSRLSYANIVATIALFAAIAGGTAAALPGKNSVKKNDLAKNSVRSVAIAANAVGSEEIQDGSVAGADVADQGLQYQDLGSNSVVARVRSTASVQSGDGGQANPVVVPISGGQWTQAENETDVFFGELTYTEPPVCTNGGLAAELVIDGELIDGDFFADDPNTTLTEPFARTRPYLFEPGTAKSRTAAIRIYDDCDNAGQQYTVQSVKLNAVAMR